MSDGFYKTPIKYIQWDGINPDFFIAETGCCAYTWRTMGIMRLSDVDGYDDVNVGDYVIDFGGREGKNVISQSRFADKVCL